MTANGKAEGVPESKVATPVKQRIIWRNVALLTFIHLLALYAAAVIIPRLKLITIIWRKCRLSVAHLHKYLSFVFWP
jgi:xanthine/uracil permease